MPVRWFGPSTSHRRGLVITLVGVGRIRRDGDKLAAAVRDAVPVVVGRVRFAVQFTPSVLCHNLLPSGSRSAGRNRNELACAIRDGLPVVIRQGTRTSKPEPSVLHMDALLETHCYALCCRRGN